MYDLVVKGGTLIDPAEGTHEKKDVAISEGRVVEIASSISPAGAGRVVDASGMFVSPGFVDLHAHVACDVVRLSVDPETACLPRGTTTAVDAGSTGELNFRPFKRFVIDRSRTRILAFLNVESLGMIEFVDLPPRHTDQHWPELITGLDDLFAPLFANKARLTTVIGENRGVAVGIKWAHHGPRLLEIARDAADEAECIIMAENHYMPDALGHLRKGDIVTHIYHYALHRVTQRRDGITEDGRSIHPEFFDAVRRGVLLDVGHGKGSFSWDVSSLALKEGLEPDTISTDLWIGNVDGPVFDMPTTMTKFLHLGLGLEKVVASSTSKPASAVGLLGEVGTLKPGARGDLVTFKLRDGRFPLVDSYGGGRTAEKSVAVIHVVKGGEVVVA